MDFKSDFLKTFPEQVNLLNALPDPIYLEMIFNSSNLTLKVFLQQFHKSLQKLKKFISTRITVEFDNYKTTSMKFAISERNVNFYENKGKFISSSLN